MGSMARSPETARPCRGDCAGCRNAHDAAHDDIDVHHLTPVAIVRAEILAAVDELMEPLRPHA
ncbi:hypothetical protein [Rhodovulum strictum]|uniref:Uncharacterized protein n=1 Tax=Rhodovulum strictum TaxID=58314 RepID=A0A844B7R2_9RHOB|nr:hypothetical protein [Rhodovulum strictum]MRH22311.1 hypothetical protein [Rhodovulum strictum]